MSIFDKIKDSIKSQADASKALYIELLGRANAPQTGDDQQLAAVMDVLNISVDQAQADFAAIQEVNSLQPIVDDLSNRQAVLTPASQAIKQYDAETATIIAGRESGRPALQRTLNTAKSSVFESNEAAARIVQIKFANKVRGIF